MSINKLEAIIRAKTKLELENQFQELISPLLNASRIAGSAPDFKVRVKSVVGDTAVVNTATVLSSLFDFLVKAKLEDATERACRKYLKRIEELESQVADLQSDLSYLGDSR